MSNITPRPQYAPGEYKALKLIEDLEEIAEFMADLDIETPTLVRDDEDGTVTGVRLTGADYAALGEFIAGPPPTSSPRIEVEIEGESVTMATDMLEMLVYLATKRAAERPCP